jgi:hypothetical protein
MISLRYQVTLLFLSIALSAMSQDNWELKLDDDNIRVYTRDHAKSNFDEFKATTTVDFSLDTFIKILKDVEAYSEWVGNTENCTLLSRPSDSVQIYHNELKVPFPFQNRDAVYLNAFLYNPGQHKLTVSIENLPAYIEEKEDLVRMPFGEGKWEMTVNPDGSNEISLQMAVDPGGSLPAWLVNRFITESPYKTLQALKEMAEKEKYRK